MMFSPRHPPFSPNLKIYLSLSLHPPHHTIPLKYQVEFAVAEIIHPNLGTGLLMRKVLLLRFLEVLPLVLRPRQVLPSAPSRRPPRQQRDLPYPSDLLPPSQPCPSRSSWRVVVLCEVLLA